MIGGGGRADPYARLVLDTIDCLGLRDAVLCPGHISEAELAAYYRTADLFWSMSEHEGFCAPMIEAMWFGMPVVAYRSSAIPETLGDAGLMFSSKRDALAVAVTIRTVLADDDLKASILARQDARRRDFLPDAVTPQLERLVERMMENCGARSDPRRPTVLERKVSAHS